MPGQSVSIEVTMAELVPYLRGWRGYFGFCETPEVLLGSNPLGALAASGCSVAAMENPTSSSGSSVGTRGPSEAGA